MDDIVSAGSKILPDYAITPQVDGSYVSTIRFSEHFSGVEGVVHGGVVSMFFDEVLGWVASQISDDWWATAYLRIDYRAPSPIGEALRAVLRQVEQKGRKCVMRGELYAGDRLCAQAEGLFIKTR